jgi:phosphatidylglycerophosphate synthase
MAFALLLEPTRGKPVFSRRRLLGLAPPLRLALSAQASGAQAVVAPDDEIAELLRDERLRIPVVRARPSGMFVVQAPANLIVHRGLLPAALKARGERDWEILAEHFPFDPPFGFSAILVTSPADAARARRALLRSLRKPQDGWTSTYLNRHISLFFTRFLVATPLRPNQVSVLILGIGVLGAALATRGTYGSMLIGAALFQAQSVLDGCDGEMSRLTFRGSKAGEWLDTVGDDLTNYGFFSGASWGLYQATQSPIYLGAGAVVLACGLLTSAIEYRYLIKIGSGDLAKYPIGVGQAGDGAPAEQKGALGRALDAIAPVFKRDTFVLITLVGAALGLLNVMLLVFAVGGLGIVSAVLKAELRMARERREGVR